MNYAWTPLKQPAVSKSTMSRLRTRKAFLMTQWRLFLSEKILKIVNKSQLKISDPDTISDELLPEYQFDYGKAQPNRFAPLEAALKMVKLDADVASVFAAEEAFNTNLRALVQSMPQAARRETAGAD